MCRPSRTKLHVGQCVRYEVRRKYVCEAMEYSSVLIQSPTAAAEPARRKEDQTPFQIELVPSVPRIRQILQDSVNAASDLLLSISETLTE